MPDVVDQNGGNGRPAAVETGASLAPIEPLAEHSGFTPRPDVATPLTRGFLFCDLRGYTGFVEKHGDRVGAELLEAYRAMVRETIRATGGGEIRTEGDSFYVVFPSASTAVRAGLSIVARAAEAALNRPDLPILVGVGIHAGESVENAGGYVGSAVNIASRVCALAAAGEVLVTDTVRSLVRTSLDVHFTSRGRPHMKGIVEPIALFSVSTSPKPAARASIAGTRRLLSAGRTWLAVGLVVALVLGAVPVMALVLQAREPNASPSASVDATSPGNAGASVPGSLAGATDASALPGRIAFSSTQVIGNPNPRSQVFVANPDGTGRRKITDITQDVLQFRTSTDKQRIVYRNWDEGLQIANIDGSGGEGTWPGDRWSQEGYWPDQIYAWLANGDVLLEGVDSFNYRLSADGKTATKLDGASASAEFLEGDGMVESPADPQLLAFRHIVSTGVHDIWISRLDGSRAVQITQGVDASQLEFSADGEEIVFRGQAERNGPIDIWAVRINGVGLRNLTNDPETDSAPTWSPDGRWIAWSRTIGANRRLWVMRSDGSNRFELPIGDPGEQLDSPVWLPDAP